MLQNVASRAALTAPATDMCAALAPLHSSVVQQVLVTVYPAPRTLPFVTLQSDVQPLVDKLKNPVTLNSVKNKTNVYLNTGYLVYITREE